MLSSILEFYSVSKVYATHGTALASISFRVTKGEFTALAGSSGSGKTTVLNLAAGLDAPSSGKILLAGKDLSQMSADAVSVFRHQSVGFVFQAYNLFPVLTALENIEYPLALQGLKKKERQSRAQEMLALVGLSGMAKRYPRELSGGQQQRVAVARAMINRPEIVFADEPTANLDSKTAEQLLALFSQMNEQTKTTFLFSSHDPLVLSKARRLIRLHDGKIQKEISTDLASRPALELPLVGSA